MGKDVEPIDQREYWDSNLDAGNLSRNEVALDLEREKRFLLGPDVRWGIEQFGSLEGKSILDIGSGLGVASLIFAERGAEVHAMDISSERLGKVEELFEREGVSDLLTVHESGAESMDIADGSIDFVFTRSVLIHTDLEKAVVEIRRVLKAGGIGVFVEPMTGNPFVNFYRRYLGPKEWRSITRYFDEERLSVVRGEFPGMRERRFYFVGFFAFIFQFLFRSPRMFEMSLWFTELVDGLLLRLFPFLRRHCWFTVMVVGATKD